MTVETSDRYPVGGAVTIDQLRRDPYDIIDRLRATEPVSWLPALNGWFVTRRDLAISAMRDADTFTVDDPRFTTAAVLGPSMLSLDGAEHERHRSPFAPAFKPGVLRENFSDFLADEAGRLVAEAAQRGRIELRTELAGPLAVNTITRFLGLEGVSPETVLDWYQEISAAIVGLTLGEPVSPGGRSAVVEIGARVTSTLQSSSPSFLHEIAGQGLLRPEEMESAAVVLMFGAIETSEGMTANLFWHLLSTPGALDAVRRDRSLIPAAIEESLRLEPAAAVIDRYATTDVELGGALIQKGELVTLSLLGANRDPTTFDDPARFNLARGNARQHVTFVQGPHGCLGLHLARAETAAAVAAVLDGFDDIGIDLNASTAPEGLIFRKPDAVLARFTPKEA